MNQMKNNKGQQGFTLVEVIVVAIIVAALAAVAVPMYTSYVTSSRINAAANAAGSVASFLGSCINQTGKASGTGVTAGSETDGTEALTLACKTENESKTISSMQLPIGIKFKISKLDTNGSVRATHVSSAAKDSALYNF